LLYQTYSGHANNVTNIIFSSDDDFFVSAAEHDRFINVWDTTAEQKDRLLLAELAADNDLIHIDLSAANDAVLAITEEGVVHLWQNASSASSTAASKLGRKKKSSVRFSESSIRVLSDKDASTIPILSATFLAQSGEVLIARNSAIKPIFEIVVCINDALRGKSRLIAYPI
jgi:U3 small nucleolar RNA-associated protein 5